LLTVITLSPSLDLVRCAAHRSAGSHIMYIVSPLRGHGLYTPRGQTRLTSGNHAAAQIVGGARGTVAPTGARSARSSVCPRDVPCVRAPRRPTTCRSVQDYPLRCDSGPAASAQPVTGRTPRGDTPRRWLSLCSGGIAALSHTALRRLRRYRTARQQPRPWPRRRSRSSGPHPPKVPS